MPELKLENSIVDDRYFVTGLLGRGSYAEVFVAYDQAREDEPVIIKALNVTLQGTPDPELEQTLVENFQNEAVALDTVRHPNIIRRLGHGTAADLEGYSFHYLVLEYMPGGDLLALCGRHPLSLDDALLYFQQVCEALAFAHSCQVIHRDMKPQNLLLSADRKTIKIADFGVAKMAHASAGDEITRVGTNVYAPPEHHPDAPESQRERLTPSADIYSLAKTVYTAITGRAPRQFSRRPIAELPANLRSQVWSAGLLAVLNRATQDRAAERYETVQAFWEDLARLKLGEAAAAEADDEATVVRRRLTGTSTVETVVAQPSFRAITTGAHEASRLQRARIVVELPQPNSAAATSAPASPESSGNGSPLPQGLPAGAAPPSRYATVRDYVQPAGVRTKAAEALRTRRINEQTLARRGFLDTLGAFVGSDWLRRAFIIILIAALFGLAWSTYYYFAEKRIPGVAEVVTGKDGVIADALNVNLRSEPNLSASVLGVLGANSRVRVVEERGSWVRVRVLSWAGGTPPNAPDGGWVSKQYVNTD